MDRRKRVAITGVGPITAIGIGKKQLWDSVTHKRTNVVLESHYLNEEYWGHFHVAKVTDFRIEDFGFSRGVINSINQNQEHNSRDLLYLITSSKMALDDSGLTFDKNHNDIGLVLTCENPGLDDLISRIIQSTVDVIDGRTSGLADLTRKELMQGLYERFEKRVYGLQTFMYLHRVSNILGLHGPPFFINNACASGLFAIELACQQIQCGNASAVIVAGGDNPAFMTKYLWFKRLGIYAEDGVMRPFDSKRNGLVFGDGAAAIVVEDLDSALRRGAFVYSEYLGGGFTQDAWKVTVPSVTDNFYSKAFFDALRDSGLTPQDVDLLNPHGAATSVGDKHEAMTIREVFGSYPERPYISAFKPYVGHNLGGSALMEVVILLLAMKENYIPATLNHTEPDPDLRVNLVSEAIAANIKVAAKMSTGFGGYNAVAVFKNLE